MEDEYNTETLNILEVRVKKLEEKVVGQDLEWAYNPKEDMISILSTLGSKLGNALSTRDRMMMVMKRIEELERYLDPSYGESCEINDEVKADLILAQEDELIMQHQNLSQLSSMKKCLDSQSIADTLNTLNSDLIQNWHKYDETSKQANEQNQQVADMLENYNSIIMTLTETFIRMDDIVTKAEVAANPEKILD